MPFLSYGGSSLVAEYMLVALLMRISDVAARPSAPPMGRPAVTAPPPDDALTEVVRR
jgi:hypothetical protein